EGPSRFNVPKIVREKRAESALRDDFSNIDSVTCRSIISLEKSPMIRDTTPQEITIDDRSRETICDGLVEHASYDFAHRVFPGLDVRPVVRAIDNVDKS